MRVGHGLHLADPEFGALCREPAIVSSLAQLVPRPVKLIQSAVVYKQPGDQLVQFGSHQDAWYLTTDPESLVLAFVPFDDTDGDNGCLEVVPGSHRVPFAPPAGALPPVEQVSEETFRKFIAALAGPRDLKRGHGMFLQACATCHRIGSEGHDVGPDLLGQIGAAEDGLLKDILMPNDRIRPGYETTLVQMADGAAATGILKDDGATSLTLVTPNGIEQVLLRKDVTGVRHLATSLMPSFAEGLSPADVANVLAWLRSNLGTGTPPTTDH